MNVVNALLKRNSFLIKSYL